MTITGEIMEGCEWRVRLRPGLSIRLSRLRKNVFVPGDVSLTSVAGARGTARYEYVLKAVRQYVADTIPKVSRASRAAIYAVAALAVSEFENSQP